MRDMPGLGDKPEDSTALPVPSGDTELSGSLLATAEMACHHVGGAPPEERVGRFNAGGRWGRPPLLESNPKCLLLFFQG